MRLGHVGLAALTFTLGCVRLGYDPQRDAGRDQPDAAAEDAAQAGGNDAAVDDAGSGRDAGRMDAAPADAGAPDAALSDAGARDGEMSALDSASAPDDGAAMPPTDAGASDAALDAGTTVHDAALCPERSDAVFCDGFDDPELARWGYTVITNGTLERTTTKKRTGAAALRATTGAATASNAARYGVRAFDHQKSGDLWLRYWYYVPSSSVVSSTFSTGVIAEVEPPYFGFSLLIRSDHVAIGSLGTMYEGTKPFPRDVWTCVELHVEVDDNGGIFEAYLDGALAVSSPATDTRPTMGYTAVDVGIHYTEAAQGPVEAYVDDVVASEARVGCN